MTLNQYPFSSLSIKEYKNDSLCLDTLYSLWKRASDMAAFLFVDKIFRNFSKIIFTSYRDYKKSLIKIGVVRKGVTRNRQITEFIIRIFFFFLKKRVLNIFSEVCPTFRLEAEATLRSNLAHCQWRGAWIEVFSRFWWLRI